MCKDEWEKASFQLASGGVRAKGEKPQRRERAPGAGSCTEAATAVTPSDPRLQAETPSTGERALNQRVRAFRGGARGPGAGPPWGPAHAGVRNNGAGLGTALRRPGGLRGGGVASAAAAAQLGI